MKHGYAIRSGLADPYFYGQEMLDLEERCSDPEEIEEWFLIKITLQSDMKSELRTDSRPGQSGKKYDAIK